MFFFRKNEKDYNDEEEFEEAPRTRRIRDLKSENKKKRKEPPKPWGKKERLLILILFLVTAVTSGIVAAGARGWKLPGLPRIKLSIPSLDFNFFGEETIVIGEKSETSKKARKAEEFFKERTKPLSGVYALYVIRLSDGSSYGVNENEVMQAASLIKLPLIAAVYKEAEAGDLSLDDIPAGQKRSYKELLSAMGHSSDNNAFIIIRKTLGDEKINKVISNLGMYKTSLQDNETTPKDIGMFFQKLWKGEVVADDSKEAILDSLTDTIFEDWLAAGVRGIRVAPKYGKED